MKSLKSESMISAETRPRRIVAAPPPTHPSLRAILLDVECADNEDVVWIWTDTDAGSVVSGYQVVARPSGC
jgi:hypothetical protein